MIPYMNVFLVDDDEDDQELFTSALQELSNTVTCTTYSNGLLAFDALQNIIPDAIFLDWNMPVMNGEEFLIAVKKQENLKDIPIIIVSTASDDKTISYSKTLGAKAFVTKPNKYSDLIILLKPFIYIDQNLIFN